MAYDAASHQLLVFGGAGSGGQPSGATWSWDGTTWTRLNPVTFPAPRSAAAVVYDPATATVVLFGGFTASERPSVTPGPGTERPGTRPRRPTRHLHGERRRRPTTPSRRRCRFRWAHRAGAARRHLGLQRRQLDAAQPAGRPLAAPGRGDGHSRHQHGRRPFRGRPGVRRPARRSVDVGWQPVGGDTGLRCTVGAAEAPPCRPVLTARSSLFGGVGVNGVLGDTWTLTALAARTTGPTTSTSPTAPTTSVPASPPTSGAPPTSVAPPTTSTTSSLSSTGGTTKATPDTLGVTAHTVPSGASRPSQAADSSRPRR